MAVAGGLPSLDVLRQLHQQLNILVTVLTVHDLDADVANTRDGLTDTAVTAEPLLAGIDDAAPDRVRPELLPFRDGFAAMRNPRAGVNWLKVPRQPRRCPLPVDPSHPVVVACGGSSRVAGDFGNAGCRR